MMDEQSLIEVEKPSTVEDLKEILKEGVSISAPSPEVPGMKTFNITDEQVLYLANPAHKSCHGLGYVGTVEVNGQKRRILCACVHRSLHEKGKTPWLVKRESRSKAK
jgi:hypothetical protein